VKVSTLRDIDGLIKDGKIVAERPTNLFHSGIHGAGNNPAALLDLRAFSGCLTDFASSASLVNCERFAGLRIFWGAYAAESNQ
jgi:hypothetical protein